MCLPPNLFSHEKSQHTVVDLESEVLISVSEVCERETALPPLSCICANDKGHDDDSELDF